MIRVTTAVIDANFYEKVNQMIAIHAMQDKLGARDTKMTPRLSVSHARHRTSSLLSYAMVVDNVTSCLEYDVVPFAIVSGSEAVVTGSATRLAPKARANVISIIVVPWT